MRETKRIGVARKNIMCFRRKQREETYCIKELDWNV